MRADPAPPSPTAAIGYGVPAASAAFPLIAARSRDLEERMTHVGSRTLHAAIKKMGIRVDGGAEPGDEGYKENFYNFAEKNKLLLR